jgi:lysophospholipase L1-like esterase
MRPGRLASRGGEGRAYVVPNQRGGGGRRRGSTSGPAVASRRSTRRSIAARAIVRNAAGGELRVADRRRMLHQHLVSIVEGQANCGSVADRTRLTADPEHTFRDDASVVMRVYFALGDSIAIDDYTGVRGGRAASQLARRLGVDLVDLTRDGNTAHGALADLARAPAAADVVTLTASGNDLPECSTTPAPSSSPPSSASNGPSSAGSGKPRSRSPARASSTTSSTVNEFFTRLAEQARAEGGTFEAWCGERRVRAALAGSSRLGR